MEKITNIIKQLEEIFLILGCDDSVTGKNKKPWIEDKVNYCLKKCDDSLTLDKINCLFDRYKNIRDIIICGNLRLVVSIARNYKVAGVTTFLDIIQYGNMGLMRAIEKFDISKGVSFSAYASKWISRFMTTNMNNISYATWVPRYLLNRNRMILKAKRDLGQLLGREATTLEISQYLNIFVDEILEVERVLLLPVSLDELNEIDDKYIDEFYGNYLASKDNDVYEQVYNKYIDENFIYMLSTVLANKQLSVIMHYYGFYGEEYNEPQIASMLGISHQRVSQIKKLSLNKLRNNTMMMSLATD